jgi:preprotein translocase subunit SecG
MPPHSTASGIVIVEQTSDEEEEEILLKAQPVAQTEVTLTKPELIQQPCQEHEFLLHPTYSLPLLVMLDMFAVSLVVPLLIQYYKDAGVTSANQRELLSSLFSSSQIVGGLLLGALADAHVLSRRTVLFLSFGGSAVAYALIVYGNLTALVISRILVGLVKQTMTVTTTLLAQYTTRQDRAQHMGRLQASTTIAWMMGPSVGALLYKNVHTKAPALVAVALFGVNMLLGFLILPTAQQEQVMEKKHQKEATFVEKQQQRTRKFVSFAANLKACFTSPQLGSAIICLLLYGWVRRTTSYATMASYYEDMYSMQPHQRGYLSSYQQVLNFAAQSLLVGPLLQYLGGERVAIVYASALMALATLLEYRGSWWLFLTTLSPAIALSVALLDLSLRSLVTHVAPKDSLGSVLAALDVLQNATAVTVPFYRTILFHALGGHGEDPSPQTWVVSTGLHWVVTSLVMGVLLRRPMSREKTKEL